MKKQYLLEILIWLIIIICTIGLMFFVNYYYAVKRNTYTIYFNDVDGIIKGSPIKFSGVVIGHVRNLKYNKDKIAVQFIVTKPDIKIKGAMVAKVEFTGIAGSKSIELTPTREKDKVYEGIITEEPIRIKDIFEYGRTYSETLSTVEQELEAISVKNVENLLKNLTKKYKWTSVDNTLDKANTGDKKLKDKLMIIKEAEENFTQTVEKVTDAIKNF